MKFKNYEREYECVFTGDKLIKKKCDLNNVTVYNYEYSQDEYQSLLNETALEFSLLLFDSLVKMTWLGRHFCYRGSRRKKEGRNGIEIDRAYGVYTRHFANFDNRFIFATSSPHPKIVSYLDDFFPNFLEGNPFKEDYIYPYRYMTIDCLVVVYQMDERLKILEYCEDKKMRYTEFLDYVLNYINCYNDENGEKYMFAYSHVFMPYIKKI